MTRYLSVAETAKLVRSALRESFPGVKFRVRSHSYAGGASIRIHYSDGPATKLVEAVANQFSGSYFDGMIDYKGSKQHRLDGELVRFMADFVFVDRDLTAGPIASIVRRGLKKYGTATMLSDAEIFELYRRGNLHEVLPADASYELQHFMDRERWQAMGKWSDRLHVEPSATLARVTFSGDDGYGQGTVGRDYDVKQRRASFQVLEGGQS